MTVIEIKSKDLPVPGAPATPPCEPTSENLTSENPASEVGSKEPAACLRLSEKDERALRLILGETKTQVCTIVDVKLPPDQHVPTEDVMKFVEVEKRAIELERCGKIGESLKLLNELIAQAPKYASAYNNRAQMRRLIAPEDAARRAALSDLESAVALARPAPGCGASKMQAQVLRNAYGQLAAIYVEQAKRPENSSRSWDLQLKASDMMVEASRYGEHIAASLAVSMNPYAKLCGNMVETVLGAYR